MYFLLTLVESSDNTALDQRRLEAFDRLGVNRADINLPASFRRALNGENKVHCVALLAPLEAECMINDI
jgi:hypothetical protein